MSKGLILTIILGMALLLIAGEALAVGPDTLWTRPERDLAYGLAQAGASGIGP